MIGLVQLNAKAPKNWAHELNALGFNWAYSEPQPIADQIKLHDMTGSPLNAPKWLEIVK